MMYPCAAARNTYIGRRREREMAWGIVENATVRRRRVERYLEWLFVRWIRFL